MRLAKRPTPYPAASTAPLASAKRFVVVQVRQALQQTPTIGAWSPYFVAARVTGARVEQRRAWKANTVRNAGH